MVPYSFKDVAVGQRVAQNEDRSKLLFYRCLVCFRSVRSTAIAGGLISCHMLLHCFISCPAHAGAAATHRGWGMSAWCCAAPWCRA